MPLAFKRMTVQRRVILEELKKLHTHPTAAELYEKVGARLPRVSLGTVYRNLESLSREGAALKLDLGSGPSRYDFRTESHNHIRCVKCGRVDDIMTSGFGLSVEKFKPLTHYQILGFELEFLGLCPKCARSKSSKVLKNA